MKRAYSDEWTQMYVGDASEGLRQLPAGSVHTCVTTNKHRHASYVGAQEALRRVSRRRKNKREARVYRCLDCGGYHLTSTKRDRERAKGYAR